MDKEEAYNLYHKSNAFKKLLEEKGFFVEENDSRTRIKVKINPTYGKPNNMTYMGEIIGQYFILHTYESNQKDKRLKKPISKLQKLAKEFEI